jgi:FkbM family methyltransferase
MRSIFIFFYKIKFFKRLVPSILKIIIKYFNYQNPIISHNNLFFYLNLKNPIDREIYLKNNYEKKQIAFLTKVIIENNIRIFLDIGAHMGFYSVNMSKHSLKTHSFEPVKTNFEQIKKNILLNKIENIKANNIALSNTKKDIVMWVPVKDKTGGFSVYNKNDEELEKYNPTHIHKEISKCDLADNIIKYKQSRIAIKIDVERHEKEVINGMLILLKDNEVIIQVEIFDARTKVIFELFDKINYKYINSIDRDYYFKNF